MRPRPVADDLAERGLLDREEGPDLVPARADDPDDRDDDERERLSGHEEDEPGDRHQERARDEHEATADAVSPCRQPETDEGITEERRGEQHADLEIAEPDRLEIEDEDDREEAVPEHPRRAAREQEPAVAAEAIALHRAAQADQPEGNSVASSAASTMWRVSMPM